MSSRRYLHGATHFPVRTDRSPNGRPYCRVCGAEITAKRRRTFCGERCAHHYLVATGAGWLRDLIYRRDKGICALCGFPAARAERQLSKLRRTANYRHNPRRKSPPPTVEERAAAREKLAELREHYRSLGFDLHKSFWEADHILPVCEGGLDGGMDNLRTLCVPCHKKATAELRARRAGKIPADTSPPANEFAGYRSTKSAFAD